MYKTSEAIAWFRQAISHFVSRSLARCIAYGALAGLALIFSVAPGMAEPEVWPDAAWTVDPPFGQDAEARNNISGAACPSPSVRQACLAVNDKKRYAQFYLMGRQQIRPLDSFVTLLPEQQSSPGVAAEATAFDAGTFYVVGRHGRSGEGVVREDFLVFRFKVNVGSPLSLNQLAAAADTLQMTDRLRGAIRENQVLAPFAEEPPGPGGVAIEGLAVKNDVMYFGLRGPSVEKFAFIARARTDSVFGTGPLVLSVDRLALGFELGIRDLIPVADGLLVLAGKSADSAAPPLLFHWTPETGVVKRLATLMEPTTAHGEAILLLEENLEYYRLLVMFDGNENGAPMQYHIPR